MARSKLPAPDTDRMLTAFRYSPGDGHTYTWAGDQGDLIKVYRHATVNAGNGLELYDTGDRIEAAGVARTSSALAERVDRWRKARRSSPTTPSP